MDTAIAKLVALLRGSGILVNCLQFLVPEVKEATTGALLDAKLVLRDTTKLTARCGAGRPDD
jgi:hypothetical protein